VMGLVNKLHLPLLGRYRRFATVDFDSCRLRVVIAEQTPTGTHIHSAAEAAVPDDMDMSDPKAVGTLLGRTLKDMAFRGSGVVMSVPRSQAVLKPTTLPPGTPATEFASMVRYQVAKELPFPIEDAVIDFTIESPSGSKPATDAAGPEIQVLVVAIRLHVVDYYKRIADAAGMKLLRLGFRPYASLCCVEAGGVRGGRDNLAMIHLTADETEIALITHGSLVFSRSAVKDLKTAADLEDHAAEQVVDSLVAEVSRSLQSYLVMERAARVDAVTVAGQTGVEARLAERLCELFHVPCELLQTAPLFRDRTAKPVSSAFVSALGLAIGHAAAGGVPFDFLNPKKPIPERDARKTRIVMATTGVIVLLIAAVVARAVVLGRLRGNVAALRAEYKNLNKTVKSVKKDADRVVAMEKWIGQGHNWLDHWAYISSLLPSARDIYLTKLSTGQDGAINFTVKATSSEVITELNKKLAQAGYTYKPSQIKSGTDKYGYIYSTTVRALADKDVNIDLANIKPAPRPADDSTLEQFINSANPSSARRSGSRRAIPGRPVGRR